MLRRKIWRDLKENKAAYLACLTVITIGLMVFTSTSMVYENLMGAKERFYREFRFAGGFAQVRGIPAQELGRLARIEGIEAIDGRMIEDVRVLMPGRKENIYLRLVSLNPGQVHPINGAKLLEGSPFSGKAKEVWLSPSFFAANNLRLGDTLTVIAAGKKAQLTVVGIAQSPDFVYALRDARDLYPAPETFGVAYIPFSTMKNLFGEKALINELVFTLKPGFSYQAVEDQLKPRLEKFGLTSIFPGKDHVSDVILTQELVQMESTAKSLPVLFLLIAAVILYILLKRMVEQQRGQIGTLKAFGFSGSEVMRHYLSYPLIIGIAGGVCGGLLGIWLSFPLTELYRMFFNLPGLESKLSLKYLISGLLLSAGFSLFAGYFGSREALRLQPAEAMRPAAPPAAKKTLLEQWRWYWKSLNVQGKMATRNLMRNKQRSFFVFLGITLSFSMIATTWYFQKISDIMIVDQFTKVQTHDVKLVFKSPVPLEGVKRELARLPGVKKVEPMLEVPATLKNNWLEKNVMILGLQQDAQLYNILADSGQKLTPPVDGLLLSRRLAESLDARVGTEIILESSLFRDDPLTLPVSGIIPQYIGINAYMDLQALNRLLVQTNLATSMLLAADTGAITAIKDKYRDADLVASVEDSSQLLDKFYELMESFGFMIWILALFALIIGFAVIYSSSIVALSERKRELASLRVLGMSPGEVLQVLTFEQWFISFFAMLAGIPLTVMLNEAMAKSMDNDLYSLPVFFEPFSFVIALIGTAFAIWVAQISLARQIHRLVLVEVLKERD
ncbi:MAG: ABC transporter permease [Bacillota bacterium]